MLISLLMQRKRSIPSGEYPLPEELARHVRRERFSPDELRRACREAGEGLGREDAGVARFRAAAEMVEMWRGLDLPAWEAPYVLRDARLGYINGYERALVSGELSEGQTARAAESRWGGGGGSGSRPPAREPWAEGRAGPRANIAADRKPGTRRERCA